MLNELLCKECQSNSIDWYCTNHKIKICKKCAFKNHIKCQKINPQQQQEQKLCQNCKIKDFFIFCQNHKLSLCDNCFFNGHSECQGITIEEYEKLKQEFINSLKQTKLKDWQNLSQEKRERIYQSIDKLIKYLNIIKDQISENDNFVQNFIESQLKDIEIRIGKNTTVSINEKYIEKCYNTQFQLFEDVNQEIQKSTLQLQKITETISQVKQTKFNLQELKNNVCWPNTDEELDNNKEKQDICQYILVTNSPISWGQNLIYNNKIKELFAVGESDYGQLGNRNTATQPDPLKITNYYVNQKILQISCGWTHTLILTDKGLYAFGENDYGQLGDGTKTNSSVPVNISNNFQGEQPKQIACGYTHNAVITQNNQLFMFGQNSWGKLGDNTKESRSTPVNITPNIIQTNNQNNANSKLSEKDQEYIVDASCGVIHTIVRTNKSLFAFGGNDKGQLGIGKINQDQQLYLIKIDSQFEKGTIFKSAKCGGYYSIVLTNNGIFTFGSNEYGQLGNNSKENSFEPVNIIKYFNDEKILSISCGWYSTMVQTEKNIYTFGRNEYGQLGDGTTEDKQIPTKITSQFQGANIFQAQCNGDSIFIETNKGLYGFGKNNYGQLGNGNKKDQLNPILLDQYYK